MDISAEIAAVQTRIAEITGVPPAPSVPPGFAAALNAALSSSPPSTLPGAPLPTLVSGASTAPAPVAPAEIDALVQQNAATWQVDPALLKAVIANESGFNANATSPVGARGVMPLAPGA